MESQEGEKKSTIEDKPLSSMKQANRDKRYKDKILKLYAKPEMRVSFQEGGLMSRRHQMNKEARTKKRMNQSMLVGSEAICLPSAQCYGSKISQT